MLKYKNVTYKVQNTGRHAICVRVVVQKITIANIFEMVENALVRDYTDETCCYQLSMLLFIVVDSCGIWYDNNCVHNNYPHTACMGDL